MNCGRYALLLVAVLLVLSLMTIAACGGNGTDTADLTAKMERLEARAEELEEKTQHLSSWEDGLLIETNVGIIGGVLDVYPEDAAQFLHDEEPRGGVFISIGASGPTAGVIKMETADGRMLVTLIGDSDSHGGNIIFLDAEGKSPQKLP